MYRTTEGMCDVAVSTKPAITYPVLCKSTCIECSVIAIFSHDFDAIVIKQTPSGMEYA